MARTDREMEAFFDRGVELMGKGELFYALQQLDLSIRRNPVDGFGRSRGTNNVLFEIEGAAHIDQFTFDPSLTEQAINDKGMMYASMGRFSDSQRQFMEATRNEPQYLEPYWNLLTMFFVNPGKRQEGTRYMEMFLTSKSFYLKRWLRKGVQNDHAKWMNRCFELYDHALRKRAVLLERIASEGDVWAYYRLVG